MVRDATRRKRRYEEKIDPDVIGARFRDLKDVMVDQQSEYFPQIANVEAKVKQEVEAAGVPSYQVAQYINVGRECYSIAKRFSQATRDQEAQRVVDKWASRGLDGPLLALACRAGGCDVDPPAEVCYTPCVHGMDKHDDTVGRRPANFVYKHIRLATEAAWINQHVNGGNHSYSPFKAIVFPGTNPNALGLLRATTEGLNSGDILYVRVDWLKRLEFSFIVMRWVTHPEAIARVQLKEASAEGQLGQRGIGLEIQNLDLYGEAYGTARGTVAMGALTESRISWFKIIVDSGTAYFYRDGVLQGTLTGTQCPNVQGLATAYVVLSSKSGPTQGASTRLATGNLEIIQDW